jgi:hypothetical protein
MQYSKQQFFEVCSIAWCRRATGSVTSARLRCWLSFTTAAKLAWEITLLMVVRFWHTSLFAHAVWKVALAACCTCSVMLIVHAFVPDRHGYDPFVLELDTKPFAAHTPKITLQVRGWEWGSGRMQQGLAMHLPQG